MKRHFNTKELTVIAYNVAIERTLTLQLTLKNILKLLYKTFTLKISFTRISV